MTKVIFYKRWTRTDGNYIEKRLPRDFSREEAAKFIKERGR